MEHAIKMSSADSYVLDQEQPSHYSYEELDSLKKFIELIKNDEKRQQLVCWGNHSDYSHGY